MNLRLLGLLGMIGGPMIFLENALFGFAKHADVGAVAIFGLLYMLGWLCSAVGLWQLAATGAGGVGRAILVIMMAGLVLGTINNMVLLMSPAPDREALLFVVTDLAWPFSHAYMFVVGIAALVARRLGGWQRWTPLAVGLGIPLALAARALSAALSLGIPDFFFAIFPGIALVLLGYAVYGAGSRAEAGHVGAAPSPAR